MELYSIPYSTYCYLTTPVLYSTSLDILEEDTGYTTGELEVLMAYRVIWRNVVRDRPE